MLHPLYAELSETESVRVFMRSHVFAAAQSRKPHVIAASFAYGREDVIPEMFRLLVGQLCRHAPDEWTTFRYYLERHITSDADEHGPLARELVARLCGDSALRWREAEAAVDHALIARLALWDAIVSEIKDERARSSRGQTPPTSTVRPVLGSRRDV
ncbi:MAG: DUF3050 domain-containing protein [Myxococcales bacterium]|nr:DUF3050 domain-containing protein [Myxococcales bacterium]